MDFLTATQSTWFLIGWIAKLLGFVMNYIFEFLNLIGIPNIGIAIILFTLVVKALMIPMSVKQQKFTKLQSVMSPELQAIQAKYKGKKDNASMMAQQEETRAVYEKYGTSATGGCLQLLIQMPILFALYQVIYHLPGYINILKDQYGTVADVLMKIEGYAANTDFLSLAAANTVTDASKFLGTDARNYVIDVLYNLDKGEWQTFLSTFNQSALTDAYNGVAPMINRINSFLGFDLVESPWAQLTKTWWVVFVPLLAGGLQFLSSHILAKDQPKQQKDNENAIASSMRSMNYIFPVMSVVFCFTFQAGIGIYWIASSGVQLIIQLLVNRHINKADINEMVRENIEKANIKRARKGLKPLKATDVLSDAKSIEEKNEREKQLKQDLKDEAARSTAYYESHTTAKPGSLAAKAGMVQQYEERERERKSGKKN